MEFHEKLRALREKKGLTQKQLAEQAGISFTSYGKYERGERIPDIDNMGAIATVLEADINELAEGLDRYRTYKNLITPFKAVSAEAQASDLNTNIINIVISVFQNAQNTAETLLNRTSLDNESLKKGLKSYVELSENLVAGLKDFSLE